MVHHFSTRQRQLRVLFLTRLETSQTLMKKQIIYELRSYSEQKRHWRHIEFNATMQLRLSKKRQIYKELVNHSTCKQKLKSIAKQADKKLKQRVLESMAAATQKQIRLNKTFTELKTSHYKSFCIDIFQTWHQATQQKYQTRQSLLERQHYFMRMRFIGKLRSQAQITKIKNEIRTKLQQFREGNLKIKAMNSLKNYLKSTNCINYKKARTMRKSNLIKKSITCLKSRTELSKLGKAIAANN